MLLQYKASLQDLVELLKLEPKNSAAQKEMDTVKMAYKEVCLILNTFRVIYIRIYLILLVSLFYSKTLF